MNKDLKNLYTTLSLLGISIIIYFLLMKKLYKDDVVNKDKLNKKIMNIPIFGKNCCSWWPISHFVSFFIWALIWPQYWQHLFGLGVAWEGIEYIFKLLTTPKNQELKFKRTRVGDGTVEYEQWWSSSKKDVVFNGMGILFGLLVRKYVN